MVDFMGRPATAGAKTRLLALMAAVLLASTTISPAEFATPLAQVGVHAADDTILLNPFLIYERETWVGDSYPVWDRSAAFDAMAAGRLAKAQLSLA